MPAQPVTSPSSGPCVKDETARLNIEREQLVDLASLLRKEKNLLQAVMENCGVMLAYLDSDFNFVEVNSAYANGCGYPVERLVGENHFVLFPDRENLTIFEKVRDTGEATIFHDKPFEFPDQPERGVTYWDWALSPVKDASGRVEGLVLSLTETTRRRLAETSLEQRERYFRALTESISDVVIVLNSDATLRYLSPSVKRLTGYKPEELAGKNVFDFVHPDDLPSIGEAFTRAMQDPEYHAMMEARLRHKDGSWRWVEGAGENLFQDPVVEGIVASFRDVTERKLSEARLTHTQKLATLGEVAGNISHELRNPLAVIGASVFYLKSRLQDSPDEKVQAHLDRIKTSVERSSVIMQTLMDMARAKEPNCEKLDLRAVVSQAIDFCNVPPSIEIEREFPTGEAWVSADRWQLLLAFRNLVTNAIEAMQQGVKLTVAIRCTSGMVNASIADTGPGIAPEAMDRMFQPMFSTKSDRRGFGLSMAKSVVDRHGGAISVKSTPGTGTVFTATLPARAQRAGGC